MNGFANGSLAELFQEATNQTNRTSGNLSLFIVNAMLAALLLHSGTVNFDAVAPVVGRFFAEGVFAVPQQCIHPVTGQGASHASSKDVNLTNCFPFFTGQCCFLNRLLYCILFVFAIASEHDAWLATAAFVA